MLFLNVNIVFPKNNYIILGFTLKPVSMRPICLSRHQTLNQLA